MKGDSKRSTESTMSPEEMKKRTKQFALRAIRLVEALPKGRAADVLGKQLLRSGCSVGANYRSACRAKSQADFVSKLGIVEEEADESMFWMELIGDAGLMRWQRISDLHNKANELVAITVSSIKTARSSRKGRRE